MSDCQTGHEKTLSGLAAMLAGSSIIYGPGMLESGMTFDPAQLVIDDEIVAMTRYFQRGSRERRQTAMEEIMEVGPAGDFIERMSTLKGARTLTSPRLIDRRVREAWEADGSPDFYLKARAKAKEILDESEIEPLPDDMLAEMRSIVAKATRSTPASRRDRRTGEAMASLERLKKQIIEGDESAVDSTEDLVSDGLSAQDILDEALLPGMDVVGARMKSGDMFIPEVLLSARTMQACLDIIKPLLEQGERLGRWVRSSSAQSRATSTTSARTWSRMLLAGTGFEVINLGKGGEKADEFIAAVKEHKPDILGMSALLHDN